MSPARIPGNGVTLGGSDLDWAVTNRFEGGGGSEVLRSFITMVHSNVGINPEAAS